MNETDFSVKQEENLLLDFTENTLKQVTQTQVINICEAKMLK